MSEEFNEGMNENRGMAEEHKGPEDNPSNMETPYTYGLVSTITEPSSDTRR